MPEDVTILIANLGQPEHLQACLRSLFGSDMGQTSFRVIVGFNFQGQGEAPLALLREFPQVERLRAHKRLGYCRAYNQLMARRTGRYALLLDDDTALQADTINGMVRFMDAHPEVGIAGCRTLNPDGSYQKTTARMYTLATEAINIVHPAAFWRDGIDETTSSWRTAGWLNGHFLLVRSSVIDQIGMLDERYYTFQCEADWCLRIRLGGWAVAYVPDVALTHIGGAHSVTSSVKSYKNLMRSHINRYYFMAKNYGGLAAFAFRPIMSAGALLRLLRYLAVWLANPGRRPEAGPKIKTYWKIFLLGAALRPEALPEELLRDHADLENLLPIPPG